MPSHGTHRSDRFLEPYNNHHHHRNSEFYGFHPTLRSSSSSSSSSTIASQTNHQFYCQATLTGHNSYISSLKVAGKWLYTASSDGVIKLWRSSPLDTQNGNVVAAGEGAVKSMVVLADKLFTAHQDHKIRVWKKVTINREEEEEEEERLDRDENAKRYTHYATLPTLSDRFVKCLLPKNQVQVRRHKKSTWVHHVDTVSALALSKDEAFLYSVSWDRTLKIWRVRDFRCLESIANAHDDAINALALADDGDVYTGSADRKIKVWRRNMGENKKNKHSMAATLERHDSGVNAIALSHDPDGCVLYSGGCDRSIVVWERDDSGTIFNVARVLRGHKKSILCLAVVSDIICSGSEDKTIRIWRNYECLGVLKGHRGPVKCLIGAIDREFEDCCLIYSGGLDCDIKVWKFWLINSTY